MGKQKKKYLYNPYSKWEAYSMKQANKHVIMAALTYNLKKLLKFNRPQAVVVAQAMRKIETGIQQLFNFSVIPIHDFKRSILRAPIF
jgi:hypothetical protein